MTKISEPITLEKLLPLVQELSSEDRGTTTTHP